MKPVNLKARILLPSVLVAAVALLAFVIGTYREENEHISEDVARTAQAVAGYYQATLAGRANKLGAALEIIAEDEQLRAALENRDRETLLARAQPIFQRLRTKYGITHFYFHDPRRVNLLRVHQPGRYGDTIDRFTALAAERTGKTAHDVELGPLGTFTLRMVEPIRKGDRLLGYIELGEDVGDIIRDLQAVFRVELLVTIDKRYLRRADWEAGMRMLGREANWEQFPGEVITAQTLDLIPESLHRLLSRDPAQQPAGDIAVAWNEHQYRGRFLPLHDARGRQIGTLVALRDMTARIQGSNTTLISLTAGAFVLGTLLFSFFYLILGRTERQLAQSQRGLLDSQARLANAQHMAHLGNWEWDIVKDTLHCSNEAREIFGANAGGCPPRYAALLALIHPADKAEFLQFIEQVRANGSVHGLKHRIVRPDGAERVVYHRAEVVRDGTGSAIGINATIHDVTEQHQAEMLSARLGRILEHSWNEIYAFDADSLCFVEASAGACRNLGYSMEELRRLTPVDLKIEYSREQFDALLATLRSGDKQQVSFETVQRRKDGSLYPVEARLQFSTGETPPVFVAIIQDISERKRYIAELERKALYDPLTGLPNRNLLQDRLQQVLAEARRETKPLALVVLGVDRLKEVNDILGHSNGDRVLCEVAERLKQALRETDAVARLGGDEFAILLPGAGMEHAALAARKIQKAMEPSLLLEDTPLDMEVSIGIAVYPDHGEEPTLLLQRADVAMRHTKYERSGFGIYDSRHDPYSLRRLRLLGELRRAIKQQELVLHYQPRIDVASGRTTGVEALVRWLHPEHGLIYPGEFVPLAEQTGLIRPLALWVLEETVRQCGRWHAAGLNLAVSINLSARNLLDPSLPDALAKMLAGCGVAPDHLTLEVTETAVMSQPDKAMEILTRLHGMGLGISIDDFGTGYSSLAYLKKLPVNELKIDRGFVSGMVEDENDAVIVRSTIDLAHNLGLKVVAEGVEEQKIMDLLMALGCDTVQGYYFSRALPNAELERWLRQADWGLTEMREQTPVPAQ